MKKIMWMTACAALLSIFEPSSAEADFCFWRWRPVCTEGGERFSNACWAESAGEEAREGGALIELDIVGQRMWVWSENDAFIEEALEKLASGERTRVPNFKLRWGGECNAPASFHVDAQDMFWSDMAIEACSGRPSDIEEDPAYWIDNLQQYCPWTTELVAIYDYR